MASCHVTDCQFKSKDLTGNWSILSKNVKLRCHHSETDPLHVVSVQPEEQNVQFKGEEIIKGRRFLPRTQRTRTRKMFWPTAAVPPLGAIV